MSDHDDFELSPSTVREIIADEKQKCKLFIVPRARAQKRPKRILCSHCQGSMSRFGFTRGGAPRYRCQDCKRSKTLPNPKLAHCIHGDAYPHTMNDEMTLIVLRLLVEGMGIRACSRVTRTATNTVSVMLVKFGELIGKFNSALPLLSPADVEVDECWTYVFKKHATREECLKKAHDIGAQWIYLAIDRKTKFLIANSVGKRTTDSAIEFMHKLRDRTSGFFTVHTDGFQPYPTAVYAAFMQRPQEMWALHEPLVVVRNDTEYGLLHGVEEVDAERSNTNRIERFNGTMRQHMRRLSRATMAFSKTKRSLEAHLELFIAYYNFCRKHSSLQGMSPAMAAGITDHIWDLRELILTARGVVFEQQRLEASKPAVVEPLADMETA